MHTHMHTPPHPPPPHTHTHMQVMSFLNQLFSLFDKLVTVHGVHKVETAGE